MQTTENDPAGVRVLELRPWIDLAPYLAGFDLVSLSLGPSGELYALAVTAPADYRETAPSGAIFPRVWTERPHDVRVLRLDGRDITRYDIPDQHWNYYHAQPLPNDELLLVVSRSRRFADDVYDRNAKVFAGDGVLKREFLLGDGIRDVQTTTDGRIWTSYFDEGIGGSFGWREPVGKAGLICWDHVGKRLYGFSPPQELKQYRAMVDCYGLNVVSDADVWCYYIDMAPAATFPLIHLRHEQIAATWRSPISGAHAIGIWKDYILFGGRFRQPDEFNLYTLDDGRMHLARRFRTVDAQGTAVSVRRATARGSVLALWQGSRCFRLDMRELVGDL